MRFLVFSVALLGCKAPVEAPEELNELSAYLYANFDAEDEETLAAGVVNLDAFLSDKDLAAALNDRAVTLSVLEAEGLGSVAPPEGADPALQVPIGVWAESAVAIDEHVALVSDPNQICIAGNSTVYSGREFTSDLDCWESGECRRIDTTNEQRVETLIANVWLDIDASFRRVALEDGRDAMVSRANMPRQYLADGGDNSWDQRYTLDVWIPAADGTTTLRYYGMWSSVTLAGVGDDVYANLVKSGIDEYYTNTDDWIAGIECDNPRDRVYDRPAE